MSWSPSTATARRATTILAVPFDADFVPSLPVRAAAAYLGIPWSDVGLALGDGVRLGDIFIPTDPAMRLVVNYRGPARTVPTYSFAELIDGKLDPALFKRPDRADRRFVHRHYGCLSRAVR